MAVEDGFSFNQIASSEFVSVGFGNLGLKHPKSRNTVSNYVNNFIATMETETKKEFVKAFQNGERFSIVIDEWTSVRNRRFLNVCVVTMDSCTNLGLARCRGSMTAFRTTELLQVGPDLDPAF
jgi:DNA-binding protein